MNRRDLLAEVERRHRASGSKVSRLKSQGVDVAASGLDPRRNLATVRRYNTRQLTSYLNSLNTFNARSTKFVALRGGQAAPLQRYSRLVHETNMYNIRTAREYGKVAKVSLPRGRVLDPVTGLVRPMTVEERDDTLRPKNFVTAGGEASARPYTPRDFPPSRINGLDALDRLANDMRRRNAKEYKPEQLNRQRREAKDMLFRIGQNEFVVSMFMLTDDQFDTLWNYSRFADDVSMRYEHIVAIAEGRRDRSYEKVLEDNAKDIRDMLAWAHALPKKK